MAKTKTKNEVNLSQQSVDELTVQSMKAQEELFKARFRMASAASKNTMQIRNLRRHVARIETFINQKKGAS